MCIDRRDFFKVSAGVAGAALLTTETGAALTKEDLPDPIRKLKPMTDGIEPITDDERRGRIEKAQKLMVENGLSAIYVEPGTSFSYYTGMPWRGGERMLAVVFPANGQPAYVCPAFEEKRARELIKFGDDIRTWQEHESPYKRVAQIFKDRGISTGKVGFEERTRFFLFDGIRKEAPGLEYVSADPVTIGCRVIKSPHELALMQRANDITLAAYKAVAASLWEGMTQQDFRELATAAHAQLGVQGGIGANFGESSAFPHGSAKPQHLKEGEVVLMDGGCGVEGYRSDISRTIVFGKPTDRHREVWNLEKKAQSAALAAAKPGVPCEAVDAAARKVITDGGFGPDYKYFTHRVGHGIGMDGHEWIYLVRGNKTSLQPGMCFSNEPGIYIYGEFGVRLEDCMHITEDGAKLFTPQSHSIDEPFA
jgi:Xaa-Pro dipeptidase